MATRGGYLAVRKSRHVSFMLHAMWSPDGRRWIHYEPVNPMTGWRAAIDKVFYVGRVTRGDRPPSA